MTNLGNFTLGLVLVLSLTACAAQSPRPVPPPSPSIQISYVEAESGPAIEVAATHRLALTLAELIAPGGSSSRAAVIEREALRGEAPLRPEVGVGVFGGSRGIEGTGIGIGLPLGGIPQPPPPGLVRARARVVVDDAAAYRQNWRDYVVRLRFGAPPGDISITDLPAPQPRSR